MGERVRLADSESSTAGGGLYFKSPSAVSRIPTGCTLLDCVLNGGWAEGRIANIVGDRSTGKTLLAIEACAVFARRCPKGRIHYCEVEAAFDESYAEALGFPTNRVEFVQDCYTVEDWFNHLKSVAESKSKEPALYIVDSLDALSDKAELKRELGEGSYGMSKPKQMGQIFRRIVQLLAKRRITLIIISQERDKIGVMFGDRTTRSGGRALDFYASQILWLSQIQTLKRKRGGAERAVGIRVRAKAKKNKAGLAFRECEFPLIFGYGIDDVRASIEFLIELDATKRIGLSKDEAEKMIKALDHYSPDELDKITKDVQSAAVSLWGKIEGDFQPKRKKYA